MGSVGERLELLLDEGHVVFGVLAGQVKILDHFWVGSIMEIKNI
jgi:hypothetical protein